MTIVELIFLVLMLIAGACKAYAVLRPNEGAHNWAWSLFWLAVLVLAFGGRVVK